MAKKIDLSDSIGVSNSNLLNAGKGAALTQDLGALLRGDDDISNENKNNESLLKVKWDNNLKLAEHEDFFHRYKKAGYKVCWTDAIIAEKMTDRPTEYLSYRKQNFEEGLQYLRKKYKTTGWVNYVNLERAKKKPLTS